MTVALRSADIGVVARTAFVDGLAYGGRGVAGLAVGNAHRDVGSALPGLKVAKVCTGVAVGIRADLDHRKAERRVDAADRRDLAHALDARVRDAEVARLAVVSRIASAQDRCTRKWGDRLTGPAPAPTGGPGRRRLIAQAADIPVCIHIAM